MLVYYTLDLLKKFYLNIAKSIAFKIRSLSEQALYSWSWSVKSNLVIRKLIIKCFTSRTF